MNALSIFYLILILFLAPPGFCEESESREEQISVKQLVLNHYESNGLSYHWGEHTVGYIHDILLLPREAFEEKYISTRQIPVSNLAGQGLPIYTGETNYILTDRSAVTDSVYRQPIGQQKTILADLIVESGLDEKIKEYKEGQAASIHQLGFSKETLNTLLLLQRELVEIFKKYGNPENNDSVFGESNRKKRKRQEAYEDLFAKYYQNHLPELLDLSNYIWKFLEGKIKKYQDASFLLKKIKLPSKWVEGIGYQFVGELSINDGLLIVDEGNGSSAQFSYTFFRKQILELGMVHLSAENHYLIKGTIAHAILPMLAHTLIRSEVAEKHSLEISTRRMILPAHDTTYFKRFISTDHQSWFLSGNNSSALVKGREQDNKAKEQLVKFEFVTFDNLNKIQKDLDSMREFIEKSEADLALNKFQDLGGALLSFQAYITDFTSSLQIWTKNLITQAEHLGLLNQLGELKMTEDESKINSISLLNSQLESLRVIILQMIETSDRYYRLLDRVLEAKRNDPSVRISQRTDLDVEDTSKYLDATIKSLNENTERETQFMVEYLIPHKENIKLSLVDASQSMTVMIDLLYANVIELQRKSAEDMKKSTEHLKKMCRSLIRPSS